MASEDVETLINKIFDDFEEQLKAKDEEIIKLKADVKNIIEIAKGAMDGAMITHNIANNKARSIVAMLFWDMKKYDRYSKVNNVQDYVNNKNKFFALESVFKKAYKMLKDTK